MNEAAPPATIVVIDDDAAMRISCQKILTKSGYKVETFENGAHGVEGVARIKPDLLVVDLKMPGLSGTEVISRVHELDPGVVIVVITGYATIDTAIAAMKCGAYDFLPKPFSPDELRIIVRRAVERRRLVLESRRAELERELLKRRFVTFVSHQLQTPLAAIYQYLDVLRQLEDAPDAASKRREWFDRCLLRTREMQALIKDWLTLARLEGGGLAKERIKVDLTPAVAGVVAATEDLARASRITVENRVAGACLVHGDPGCVTVLIDNLVENAIKYNQPGGTVTIAAECKPEEVVLSVSDTGIGIPKQYQQLLFEEFFRIEQPGAARRAGSGLGLAITKRIVTDMGGSIEVDSEENAGSRFRVRLPAWQDSPADAPAPVLAR